ncbi:hypothetical protein R1sor_009645 [Riccia sorocarpa]|uniref:Uncharacterized protein n=1 Tax=Riccia sorocarpa TaxID=122646 RepID=A0ABD3I1T5_9MARC
MGRMDNGIPFNLDERFPDPITDLNKLRERRKVSDPNDLPEADLATELEGGTTTKAPKKNKLVEKQSKPSQLGPKIRFKCNKPKALFSAGVPPRTIRMVADLPAPLEHDIKCILDSQYTSLVSQLGSGPED